MNTINIPNECKLSPAESDGRLTGWSSIQSHISSVVQLANGISAKVPSTMAQAIQVFAAAEAECCPSMLFEITESGDHVGFQITSEEIDTVRAIHSLFSEGNN